MGHYSIYTGDMTANTYEQDFSPLVLAPPLPGADISVWPLVGKMTDGTNPRKFEWIEEEVSAITGAIGEDMDTTETDWTWASGALAGMGARAGMLIKNATDRTKVEVIEITSVDSTTATTVVRDKFGFVSGSGGGTTGETHTSGDTFEIVNYSNFEGSAPTVTSDSFVIRDRAAAYNYYSLIDDWTNISGSDLATEYRGAHPDNWGYQIQGLVQRLDRQFERTLMHSGQKARSSTERGSMGGLLWFATQSTQTSAGMYDGTDETFSYEVWDDGVKALFEANGDIEDGELVTLIPVAGLQVAAYIHESSQTGEYMNELVRGLRCTSLQSTLQSKPIPLVPVRHMPSDSFMIVNLAACRIHFLEGRALKIYTSPLGDNLADRQAQRYLSEMTLECHRPTENIFYHDDLTYTRPS
jgi:hypothetical protein